MISRQRSRATPPCSMNVSTVLTACLLAGQTACATLSGAAPRGAEEEISTAAKATMAAVGNKVRATIVWSSSRLGNHDIFGMNADGSNVRQLTSGDEVDWFPRFSPDGNTILFVRSKQGWVSERDANRTEKWDLFTMAKDGSKVTRVVENASWGNWLDARRIIYVRGGQVIVRDLEGGSEQVFMEDRESSELEGLLLQQPQLSPDGRFLGLTMRGARRETGVWDAQAKTWVKTGEGCQINWWPDGKSIYWVNPSGNGGSEIFRTDMTNGRHAKAYSYEEMRFMDLPERRSHEYFPQLSDDGRWLVWAATQRGHDHDIADYDIYIWQVGARPEEAARLTFHSGNDRWPDIHLEP